VTVGTTPNTLSAVSDNGQNIVLTATSQVGPDQGTVAVFSQVDGASTVDVSQSETATPTNGARFQAASADGTKVFFTANYGITVESSSGPEDANCGSASVASCDLYEYDFSAPTGQRLTDLSAHTAEPGGAAVAGVVATSQDGEYVYFAARGQLVPGAGATYAENQNNGTYSIYLAHGGEKHFVGSVRAVDLAETGSSVLLAAGSRWAAHVTPDGEHLLFGSGADVTGFDAKGTVQAYLYSANADATVCVSCRRDGGNPESATLAPLPSVGNSNSLRLPVALSPSGEQAFFLSRDSLAPGALDGKVNLYEWRRGQTYLLATTEQPSFKTKLRYFGASDDATDVYFTTQEQMNWEDTDGRFDLYVARSGGGFAQPGTALPCNPLIEGSCGGAPGSAPPAAAPPLSALLSGSGNPPGQQPKKKGKRKKGKKQKGKQKGESGSKSRSAHGNRGTSK